MFPKGPHFEALVPKVLLLGDGVSGLQDGVYLKGDCGIPVPSFFQFIPALRGGIFPPHNEQVCCYGHGKPSMVVRTCYIRRWENYIDNGGISPFILVFFTIFTLKKIYHLKKQYAMEEDRSPLFLNFCPLRDSTFSCFQSPVLLG